ncbi:MAG TPA: hypothetical protein EYP43_04665, partial [Thermoplasmata archaeon]|nr:hypothetical protein [Thermoplasmata archaeon]
WELGRVYIDSAATGFKGNVHVIIPPGQGAVGERTACMRCFYPVQPADDAGAAACTLPGHARTREHCILKGEEMFIRERGAVEDYTAEDLVEIAELARRTSVESPYLDEQTFTAPEVENVVKNKLPAIITVNAVVASILSHEVLKALHRIYERDIGPLLDPPYLEYSARYGIFTPMGIEPDEGCPVCGTGAGVGTLTVTTPTVGGLLEALSGMGIAADGALVTRALDGTVVSRPGGGGDGTPLADLGVSDAERIRVTYREDGERRSVVLEVAVEEDR